MNIKVQDSIVPKYDFDVLSPSKAAFYSAILPGLGQAYNKKYWKIPFVYGALGTGIYFYSANNKNYDRARTAYKLRLNGKPDEFDGLGDHILLSDDALVTAQKGYKKDRDLSLLVTVALYVLQILEASTNAHLIQHNVDNNLSIEPTIIQDFNSNNAIVGASLSFKF
ncbi:DUF5683 domain-containing protein [Lutibacter oricola]|uniref:DUF5683 domain-containing protein n=1 Tax=Lutibacter oricola TaxID=762486 RepID=UPI001FE217C0|nr:DUF5683 domain-containing protein [Lutibacter oricola]